MTIPTTAISARATGLPPQAIREVMEAAWRRRDALHLEVGEPGFPTPAHIVEAAARAARDGHTKYTPNAGIAPLREALAEKVGLHHGYEATPEQSVVGAGGVQILHNVLLARTDPEDEILLPAPAWPDFVRIAHLLATPPRYYHQTPETGFLPTVDELPPGCSRLRQRARDARCGRRADVCVAVRPHAPLPREARMSVTQPAASPDDAGDVSLLGRSPPRWSRLGSGARRGAK